MKIEQYRAIAKEMGIENAEYCIGRYVGQGGMVRWSTFMHGLSWDRARDYVRNYHQSMAIRLTSDVLAEIEQNAKREAEDARKNAQAHR